MPIEIDMLRKFPYFSTLKEDDLAQLAMLTVERHFNRGDLILIAGKLKVRYVMSAQGLSRSLKLHQMERNRCFLSPYSIVFRRA